MGTSPHAPVNFYMAVFQSMNAADYISEDLKLLITEGTFL